MNKKKDSTKNRKAKPGDAKEKLNVSMGGNPPLHKPKKRQLKERTKR